MPSDELIRAVLLAEADRAPSDVQPSDLLGEVGPRRGTGRRLGVMIPAAAAVVVVAAGIPLVANHFAGGRQVQTASPVPAGCPLRALPAVTDGAALSFPVCYLPTTLPAGWIAASRKVTQGGFNVPKPSPTTILSWEKPGHGSQKDQYMYLSVGTAPDLEPEYFAVYDEIGRSIVGDPRPAQSGFATTKQVGPDHPVDINGAAGTRRVLQTTLNFDHRLAGTLDTVSWSPAPGVVLTLHMGGVTSDQVDILLAVARSVAPSQETVTLPFRVPAMPAGARLADLNVLGTSPRNWLGVADFTTPGSTFVMSWGPADHSDRMPTNVTVRGGGAFYEHIDTGDGDIELMVDGISLVVQGKPEAELAQIANGMTFQPDAQYPWLGR